MQQHRQLHGLQHQHQPSPSARHSQYPPPEREVEEEGEEEGGGLESLSLHDIAAGDVHEWVDSSNSSSSSSSNSRGGGLGGGAGSGGNVLRGGVTVDRALSPAEQRIKSISREGMVQGGVVPSSSSPLPSNPASSRALLEQLQSVMARSRLMREEVRAVTERGAGGSSAVSTYGGLGRITRRGTK